MTMPGRVRWNDRSRQKGSHYVNKNVRGLKWLVGSLIGVSMLGACGVPADEETASGQFDPQPSGEVAVRLSVMNSTLSARENVAVTVTLTNVSAQPVRLLKWYIPGDDFNEGLFEITRNGEPVEYIGPHFKRVTPRPEDFVVLAPGESLSGSAPVSGLYDLSETGSYTLNYSAHGLEQHGLALTKAAQLDSNTLNLWIEGRDSSSTLQAQAVTCNRAQQSAVITAMNSAISYANTSSAYLNSISSGTPRYTAWFGTFSSSRLNTARNHFTHIKNAFASPALLFDCSCTRDDIYAGVIPTEPYKIYLCGAFWRAPNTGTNSRAGTLIHEMSHFTVVASTNDWAYGQSAAKNLAKSNASRALNNADNYEYFAENHPALK